MGFFGKQWVYFLKGNVFDTTSHMIFFYKAYAFYPKKAIHVLHKISFHNTIPHRSHSLIV